MDGFAHDWPTPTSRTDNNALQMDLVAELHDGGFEPQTRARSNTWPCPRPENFVDPPDELESTKASNQHLAGDSQQTVPNVSAAKKNSSRRNAWGNLSYADLITHAIGSATDKRLTLSQIYEWMVHNVPYFKDKGDSNSSAGWKNSIRHNLSLHNRFMRVQNEGTGKSSWWMLNPDAKQGKSVRRRAASMETSRYEKRRGRAKKRVEALRQAGVTGLNDNTPSPSSSISEGLDHFPESPLHSGFPISPDFRQRASSNASSCGRLSPRQNVVGLEFEWGFPSDYQNSAPAATMDKLAGSMAEELTLQKDLMQQQQQQQQQHHHHQQQGPPPMTQHPTIGMFDANEVPEVIQNPATIGVFQSNSVLTNGSGNNSNSIFGSQSNSSSSAANDPNQATRETGIIEKLLHSYGFIQCCERQARLFFHFSQFSGNIDHLKIGDPVEFEMTYDRRTGKPIASQVSKIAPEVVLSEERVTGTVTTELRVDSSNNLLSSSETTGRISYENRGECFFLPYTKDDVEGNVNLRAGDKVSFQIATNQRGNLGACHIRLENPAQPVKYRGVVCSMKESFGFIERADVVKEIFFHFSEAEGNVELRPGDDVEFTIQTRSGREFACNITRLPPGSVIFEDVDTTIYKGQVLKPLDRNNPARQTNDPLPGRIRYRAPDYSEVEVPFGDKDQKGDFTLRHGDWVQFLLATDRRDQLQRATSISLLDETFKVSGEKREQGVISSLKEGFGFIRCVERNVRIFFHYTEILDTSREIALNDEVEFTVVQEQGVPYNTSRLHGIRIKHLPTGTVQFETLMASNIEGYITREAPKSPVKSQDRVEGGVITYEHGELKKTIMYFLKDCEKPPRIGDRVRFDIYLVKRNKELIAVNVQNLHNALQPGMQTLHQAQLTTQQQQPQLLQQQPLQQMATNTTNPQQPLTTATSQHHLHIHNPNNDPAIIHTNGIINAVGGVGVGVGVGGMILPQNGYLTMGNNQMMTPTTPKIEDFNKLENNNSMSNSETGQVVYRGFIAVIKENFGFIETLSHDEEVFFHFSNYVGNPNWLELGQEVEYTLSPNGNTSVSGNCLPAENVRTLPKGSIPQPAVLEGVHNGVVARPLRCINPDQQEYAGLIEVLDETRSQVLSQHEFGITSLVNKRDLLQKGDLVSFKIDETGRAGDITAVRQKKRATVDSIKGQFGFLNYEIEDGKKLFFHMSEVQGNAVSLHPGDTVEFSVVTNQRNGKSSACNVLKINDRPDRLISRLKLTDDTLPRLIVIRAPKGPQGKGFAPQARLQKIPGVLVE